MHGYELARRLRHRAECASTRLVALTWDAASDLRENGESDFDGCLVEPPSLEELADVLRQ
ncbi:hypothetical protein VSR68_08750 [Paraburkholderia phymatum]|uniref:hypothetical protein n=1 Tax=Paraburkholderia phymatum TaxID=148447 RepID=UPI00317236CF